MNSVPFQALACPLDGGPLMRIGSSWQCGAGHNFDIARQGYSHLLPVQHKRSRDPGDSKAMVAARRRFLDTGHYQPIATAINNAILQALEEAPRRDLGGRPDTPRFATTSASCLDAGCGEGYYLRQLAAADSALDRMALLGLDISKWAVASAAGQDRHPNSVTWVVGSNAGLPVQTGTLDVVLCIFGFPVYAEFARVLRTGGYLLQVDAGAGHLRELREIIYPVVKNDADRELAVPDGYTRLRCASLRYPLELDSAGQIADLLAMTPHLYRANAEGREKAAALTSLAVTVDVRLTLFQRQP